MSHPKLPEGGYEDLSWVTPEIWRNIGGTEEEISGSVYFGTNEGLEMNHWQLSGEYPAGQPSQFGPRWDTYNVVLMFYPEDGTLEIEFRFRGQDVTIGGTDETGDGKTRKELPLSRIPNRQARPNLLRWKHFWYSAEWSSDEEIAHHWKNLVDIYLFMIETVLDKLVQKRECN